MARPSSYKPEIVEEICNRLSEGETLEQICRSDHMPSSRAVYDWIDGKVAAVPESVSTDIARARDIGFDVIAERTRPIARGLDGSTGDVQRDKLVIWTDLQLLSKWSKKYADKQSVEVNHKGTVGVLTADLSAICGLLTQLASNRTDTEIQGDVPDRSVLPAPIRTE